MDQATQLLLAPVPQSQRERAVKMASDSIDSELVHDCRSAAAESPEMAIPPPPPPPAEAPTKPRKPRRT